MYTAEGIIRKEYGRSRNMITDRVLAFYRLPDGAAELSAGESLIRDEGDLFGVSVVLLLADGSTLRDIDRSKCFNDRESAEHYIADLGGKLDNPGWLR